MQPISSLKFFERLRWIDSRPLLETIEPYRRVFFAKALDSRDGARVRYNLVVSGRAKKNFKTADVCLAALYRLLTDAAGGNQCYLVANDLDQANDDLDLVKLLIKANPRLTEWVHVKQRTIERTDARGFLEILPAQDVAGSHGKTYLFCGFDEIHGYRNWDLLEALQLDPTRADAQMFIASYASIYHKPGVPLFDLCQRGWAGDDPRMLFSWYAADRTTDPDFVNADPETRANPSRGSWGDTGYLEQQRRRLPSHKYRRLHLNLPGSPEGSAYAPESVMDAVERGVAVRSREAGVTYHAFVDMSGGSSDDAVLGIAHQDEAGRSVLDRVMDQGQRPPFDPNKAVARFCLVLREYGITRVTGDRYAGRTFSSQFEAAGFVYDVSENVTSEIYESLEPLLNSHKVVLLDIPDLEQQLLGLVWRGGKITHPGGEHDDWATAGAGALMATVEELEAAGALSAAVATDPFSQRLMSLRDRRPDLRIFHRSDPHLRLLS